MIPAFSCCAGSVVMSPCSPPSYEPLRIGPCAAVEVNLMYVGHQLFSAATEEALLKLDRRKCQQSESQHEQTCNSEDAQKPPCGRHHIIRHRVSLILLQPPELAVTISFQPHNGLFLADASIGVSRLHSSSDQLHPSPRFVASVVRRSWIPASSRRANTKSLLSC